MIHVVCVVILWPLKEKLPINCTLLSWWFVFSECHFLWELRIIRYANYFNVPIGIERDQLVKDHDKLKQKAEQLESKVKQLTADKSTAVTERDKLERYAYVRV